ncbi:C40 family peptidase [Varibaculum cambriense]|uniref:C40 family peptidase n=1 Tax=Varibaculum cambriense TaxID=184870 RepID=UPI0039F5CD99
MTQKLQARHRAPSRPSTPVSQAAKSLFSSENGKRLSALAGSGVALTVVAAAAVPASADATAAKQIATSVDSAQLAKGTVEKLTVNQEVTSAVAEPTQSNVAAKVSTAPAAAAPTQNTQRSSSESAETFVGRDLGKADGTAVGIAMQYRGVPYVWGGQTPSGFDCSGFVGYVYRQLGYSLPRSANAIAAAGTKLPLSQAQPGDILWHNKHVAIYIGGGKLIHAPKPGDVVKVAPIYSNSFKVIRL